MNMASTVAPPRTIVPPPPKKLSKLPWKPNGYQTWQFRTPDGEEHQVSYVEKGDRNKPSILLIHGFGASLYHYRYNIPELAKHYNVFGMDLLGFGQSAKPLVDYNAELWASQVNSFIREVIGKESVVLGNSLGGFVALSAAAMYPQLIKGVVLVNAAGSFDNVDAIERAGERTIEKIEPPVHWLQAISDSIFETVMTAIKRFAITTSFLYTKQPARIRQVLEQVYSVDPACVDDDLVDSIYRPSLHPNAAEVFYRVISRAGTSRMASFNQLLAKLESPLLLLWGEHDPWIRSSAADRIQQLHPSAQRVSIEGGHCPHDEAPEVVNKALLKWMREMRWT